MLKLSYALVLFHSRKSSPPHGAMSRQLSMRQKQHIYEIYIFIIYPIRRGKGGICPSQRSHHVSLAILRFSFLIHVKHPHCTDFSLEFIAGQTLPSGIFKFSGWFDVSFWILSFFFSLFLPFCFCHDLSCVLTL